MNLDPVQLGRLQFLTRVAERERWHLLTTDQRVFSEPFTLARASALTDSIEEAERVEAFVSRFGRLQDMMSDKLLPLYLEAVGELVGPAIDNLDRVEKLGLIPSSDDWLAMRKLRNHMVHEYIEDSATLADALQSGHEFVPTLSAVVENTLADVRARGWTDTSG